MSCAEERCATKAIKLIIYPVGIPPPQIKEMTDMFVIRSCSSSPSSFSSPAIDMLVASNYDKKYHLYASNYALISEIMWCNKSICAERIEKLEFQ